MKHILFFASGNSRRFGENKLLHVLNGKPLYRHGLDMLAELVRGRADCTLTVVSRYAAVRAGAEALGVRAVDSPESEKGLSYTIRAGLDALTLQDGDFIVFVVADQPYLTAETVVCWMRQVLACAWRAWYSERGAAIPTCFARRWHPICARSRATRAVGSCCAARTACWCRQGASGSCTMWMHGRI